MNDPHIDLDRLIDRISDGTMDREEFSELEARLLADPGLRRRFRSRMRLEANLRSEFQSSPPELLSSAMMAPHRPRLLRRPMAAIAGMAAMLAFAAFLIIHLRSEDSKFVATIVSEDGAAWSKGRGGGEGGRLVAGTMRLEKGLASLRFKSGAVVELEAPVTIALLDPMRCRLGDGKAVFDVPESAHGFVVEAPGGYAVDHGTQFAVTVGKDGGDAEFGVVKGSISVFHDAAKTSAKLFGGDMVLLTRKGISPTPALAIESDRRRQVLNWRTEGREDSVIRGNRREQYLFPDLLMVKKDAADDYTADGTLPKDRRSLFGFEVGTLDKERVKHVLLNLNLVSSGVGYANLLPEKTTFQVYGVRDGVGNESWRVDGLKWEDAPGSLGESGDVDDSEVSLLGTFDVPRSMLEGQVVFESPELDRFIHDDTTGVVDFMVLTQTTPVAFWSRVHAFATSKHIAASGPTLKIETEPEAGVK